VVPGAQPRGVHPRSEPDAADWIRGFRRRHASSLQNGRGETFGFAWEGGASIMAMGRYDLIEARRLSVPTTFDELVRVCETVHTGERRGVHL